MRWDKGVRLPSLRWSNTVRREAEAVRNRIMFGLGTDEDWIEQILPGGASVTWRKPLSIPEINQMAPTAEVRARPGRP